MREPFRGIYNKLEEHPRYDVWESDVKSINTAISHFLNKQANKTNENFADLQQYILYLQTQYPERHLKTFDFQILRDKMMKKYPHDVVVF